MMTPVQRWSAPLPEVDLREMLRYAACRAPDEQVTALAASVVFCRVEKIEGFFLLAIP